MRIMDVLILLTGFVLMAATPDKSLVVKSKVFDNNGMIPVNYTCEGAEVSPPLTITHIPSDAKTLAIICHDPDADMPGGCTHWVVWNIDVNGEVQENFKGAKQGMNCAGKTGYLGMCPSAGAHHYNFRVYALDTELALENNTDKAALEKAMHGHILAEGMLTGLYKKAKQ